VSPFEKILEILLQKSENDLLTNQEFNILMSIDWRNLNQEGVNTVNKLLKSISNLNNNVIKQFYPKIRELILSDFTFDVDGIMDVGDTLYQIFSAKRNFLENNTSKALELLLNLKESLYATEDDIILAVSLLKNKGFYKAATELALSRISDAPRALNIVSAYIQDYISEFPKVKVGLLGYSTLNFFKKSLHTAFASRGFNSEIISGNYGQVIQELLSPNGIFYKEQIDALFILLDFYGMFPIDWRIALENQENLIIEKIQNLINAIKTYTENFTVPVLINSLIPPPYPLLGFQDNIKKFGSSSISALTNQYIADLARQKPQVIFIDTLSAFYHIGFKEWWDPRLWYYGKIPFSSKASNYLSLLFADTFSVLKNGIKKVIALDLDNTLWGGILGEDGIDGIKCDDEFPGIVFKDFQRECLRLKNLGMILVIVSKNDPDAIEVFDKHHGMILKKEDFAAYKINWLPKAQNIKELAKELNLGLNSFVFLDDSHHERAAMRKMCPEVFVPELPDDPAERPLFLRGLPCTWILRLTDEDRQRTEMYKAQFQREIFRKQSGTLEDYLKGLEQNISLNYINEKDLPRIAQLHQRTNQFNLTTLRLDVADLRKMMEKSNLYIVLSGRAKDRFGDHGLVITSVVELKDKEAEIKSFLMSCRVIGRELEKVFLYELLQILKLKGIQKVYGWYIPSAKNSQVKDFYGKNGFNLVKEIDGSILWECNLNSEIPVIKPDFINVIWD
jgi:FkbH-like protein